jgi:hypothetical protein
MTGCNLLEIFELKTCQLRLPTGQLPLALSPPTMEIRCSTIFPVLYTILTLPSTFWGFLSLESSWGEKTCLIQQATMMEHTSNHLCHALIFYGTMGSMSAISCMMIDFSLFSISTQDSTTNKLSVLE